MTRAMTSSFAKLWTLALGAALASAGAIHCLLTPEHMAMSPIFGAGFLGAGVAQLGMAGLALIRPSRLLYAAVIASTVVLSSMYAYNVLVGLPFHDDAARAAAGKDHANENAGDSSRSLEAAHSEAAGHAEREGHPSDVSSSAEASSSAGAGHDEGEDREQPAVTDHHEDGLLLGRGEPVNAYGAVTQLAQLSAAAIAAVLLARSRRLTA